MSLVLVVDDTPAVREPIAASLRLAGYRTATAADGKAALAAAVRETPSLIILDVSMPVMDGLTALPLVKQASPDTRVVIFSAFDSAEMRERAKALGADGYVRKGAAPEEIVGSVKGTCG